MEIRVKVTSNSFGSGITAADKQAIEVALNKLVNSVISKIPEANEPAIKEIDDSIEYKESKED
jgi:hypothetical protein